MTTARLYVKKLIHSHNIIIENQISLEKLFFTKKEKHIKKHCSHHAPHTDVRLLGGGVRQVCPTRGPIGGGVRQVCPTRGPAGLGVDPSAAR